MKAIYLFLSFIYLTNIQAAQLDACNRGPLLKVWVDSPNTEFIDYLLSLNYEPLEAYGIGYLICRNKKLATVTNHQLRHRHKEENREKVDKYLRNLNREIDKITSKCAPGKMCSHYKYQFPLEGKYNHLLPGLIPLPIDKNISTDDQGMKLCIKGTSDKIWMDRPHAEMINFLFKLGFNEARAFGVGYLICRNRDVNTEIQINRSLNQFLKVCSRHSRCDYNQIPKKLLKTERN
jgi:hypothetical protein